MGVFKKDNRWYIDYYLPDGKRKREVVTIPGLDPSRVTRLDALKALAIRKGQMAGGKFEIVQTKKPVPFEKLTQRYLEYSQSNKKSYTRDITSSKALMRFFGGKTIQQISPWLIEKYKAERQKDYTHYKKPITKATINRELACLKNMFTKAIEWGYVTVNPVKKVKLFPEKQEKLRVVSEAEFQKLFSVASPHFKPILLCAYMTGMRRSEIARLKWDDVNLKGGYIQVVETKNNDSRIIPVSGILLETLQELKKESKCEYVFTTHEGEPYTYITAFKRAWYATLRRSKIAKCRFHDLRHSFATRLVMAGVDIVTVQELMGHRDIKMTKRYSHPTPEHKKQAIERINLAGIDTYLDTKSTEQPAMSVVTS